MVPIAAVLLQACANDEPLDVVEVRSGMIVDPCIEVNEFASFDSPDAPIALQKCIDIPIDTDTGDADTGDTDASATGTDGTSDGTWGSSSDTSDSTGASSTGDTTGDTSATTNDSATSDDSATGGSSITDGSSGGESGGGESGGGESGGGESGGGESGGGESGGGESGGGESGGGETGGSSGGQVGTGEGGEAGGDDGGGGNQPIAWAFTVNTKSFIGPLAWGGIGGHPGGAIGVALNGMAPYLAFAAATDAAYKENPPSGLMASGQYRLFGSLLLSGTCTVGSKNIVVNNIDKKGWAPTIFTDGGQEVGPIYGKVNKTPWKITRVKDANGDTAVTISYVVSGHPNLLLEPGFQVIWPRVRTDIWHRVEATFTCDPKNGVATVNASIQGSTFPSHRLWIYGPGAKLLAVTKIVVQGAFNNLWSLPAVPAP